MTEETAKQRMIRRIRAILSKTVENGATEAEALSAAQKAADLMREYGLNREAVEAEAFVRETFASKKDVRGFQWGRKLAWGVGYFTGTYPYCPNGGHDVVYAGRETDALFASWLTDALDGFVTRNALAYIAEVGGLGMRSGRGAYLPGQSDLFGGGREVTKARPETEFERRRRIENFGMGVCARIRERLKEMSTTDAQIRREQALRKLQAQGMSFKSGCARSRPTDGAAFNAGLAAGDRATFSRPINAGGAQKQISAA